MIKLHDEDFKDLWDAYEASGSGKDKARIAEAYLPLVEYLAHRLASTLPVSVEIGDLVSLGTIGLLKAIDRFDRSRGFQFRTYCEFRVRGAMLDYLRANDWVPRAIRTRTALIERTQSRLHAELGRRPTDLEMAEAIGISLEEYERLRLEVAPVNMCSLTADSGAEGECNGVRLLDSIGDPKSVDRAQRLRRRSDVRDLLIKDLTPKEKVIIKYYYYYDLTMREIGVVLHITESRVSQLHSRMIRRLRERHADRTLEQFV